MKKILNIIILFFFFLHHSVFSQNIEDELWEDEWQEETKTSSWHGFVEAGYGYRFNDDTLFDNQNTLNEIRLYLENDFSIQHTELQIKGSIGYDDVLEEVIADVRDLSLSFSLFGNTDFKIGRQITSWGTGDLLFLNDQFPKDFDSYFNGRGDVYVKAPANAIRITSFFDALNIDIVWTPQFTPDEFINGERFSFFSPLAQQNIGGQDVINDIEPASKFSNGEIALRFYKTIRSTEYAFYLYRGFDKRPLGFTENFRPTYHRRNLFGASIRGNLWQGLYNIEFVYEKAVEDTSGNNPFINNGLSKFLIGYETEFFPKFTVAFQGYLERIHDYNNLINASLFPQFENEENRLWITNRVTYITFQDKLTFNLFSFFSPTDTEYFLRWNAHYRKNDHWSYVFGFNLIDGKDSHTFFNQFRNASNAYARIRYNF